MENIQKIHDEIFLYLQKWSENERQKDSINPYFYMRNRQDERFKKGYWFPGNETYLCVSFWLGGDSHNRTPNVYFAINLEKGCSAALVSKDSPLKSSYFTKIVESLNYNFVNKYEQAKSKKAWYKKYSNTIDNYIDFLDQFIKEDKRQIDTFLKSEKAPEEEFISEFNFIDQQRFETMYSSVIKERQTLLLSMDRLENESNSRNKLPITLSRIDIEYYQGINKTSISDLPSNAHWIFITGDNGYGKTSFLRALALCTSDNLDYNNLIEDQKTRIEIELDYKGEIHPLTRTKYTSAGEYFLFEDLILGYGPIRLNIKLESAENKYYYNKSDNIESLFDNTKVLKNINYELFASSHTNQEIFNELERIIKIVTNNKIFKISVVQREVLFTEQLDNNELLEPQPLLKLPAGFINIINLIFDIYLRFYNKLKVVPSNEFYGVVLIDEIENHFHPNLQRTFPETLAKVFPNIQFIGSTHSPITLLGAPKNSVILKVNRTLEEGIIVERIIIDNIETLTPNILFTSPIFGFTSIISDNLIDKSKLRTEDSWPEMINNDKLDKELTDLYNSRKNK